jgi:hypothetical protein
VVYVSRFWKQENMAWGALWPQLIEVQLEGDNKFAIRVIHTDNAPREIILIESKLKLEGGSSVCGEDGTIQTSEVP